MNILNSKEAFDAMMAAYIKCAESNSRMVNSYLVLAEKKCAGFSQKILKN